MLHVDDAVRATLELMAAPAGAVRDKRSYNITGASLSPQELGQELRDTYPFREIDVWNLPDHPGPVSLDDSALRGVENVGESLEQVTRAIVEEV